MYPTSRSFGQVTSRFPLLQGRFARSNPVSRRQDATCLGGTRATCYMSRSTGQKKNTHAVFVFLKNKKQQGRKEDATSRFRGGGNGSSEGLPIRASPVSAGVGRRAGVEVLQPEAAAHPGRGGGRGAAARRPAKNRKHRNTANGGRGKILSFAETNLLRKEGIYIYIYICICICFNMYYYFLLLVLKGNRFHYWTCVLILSRGLKRMEGF